MSTRQLFSCVSVVLIAVLFAIGTAAQEKGWRPVTPEELQLKTPRVEPGADAEVLFWDVRVSDEYTKFAGFKANLDQYIRIKIFTDRGRDEKGKVDITYGKVLDLGVDISLKDISARTIRPDGTAIELKQSEIFDREVIKGKGIKFKAKSFVMPDVQAGSIIEYKWRETRNNALTFFVRLEFSRDIPVQSVKYSVKPLTVAGFPLGMRLHSFNTETGFTKDTNGFYSTRMTNVPSFHEEPLMPAEYEVRPWVLAYYDNDDADAPAETYWKLRGRRNFNDHKNMLAPTDEIRRAAVQAIGDASETEERVRRIYEFCQKNIRDIEDDAANIPPDQLKNFENNKTTQDTLKHRYGTRHDIQMLFGAMLNAVNIDARVANISSRNEARFERRNANDFFIRFEIISVKIGDSWRFFDPAQRYESYGSLCSCEEQQWALVSDANEPFWVLTPALNSEKSNQKRSASYRISEKGSIEGSARIEFTGHLAQYYKEYLDELSTQEREKFLVGQMKKKMPSTSEITGISIENVQEPEKPLILSFNFRVPDYVEQTGKRMFLQPNVFEREPEDRFTAVNRKYDISFDYAWSEDDKIIIDLPEGFKPESIDTPPDTKTGKGTLIQSSRTNVDTEKSKLEYIRHFAFGDEMLEYSRGSYSLLRNLFGSSQTADSFRIVLTR